MKKYILATALLGLSGCYSSYPPVQDVYYDTGASQTVIYTQPTTSQTTYVTTGSSSSVIYVDETTYAPPPQPVVRPAPHRLNHQPMKPMPVKVKPKEPRHEAKPAAPRHDVGKNAPRHEAKPAAPRHDVGKNAPRQEAPKKDSRPKNNNQPKNGNNAKPQDRPKK